MGLLVAPNSLVISVLLMLAANALFFVGSKVASAMLVPRSLRVPLVAGAIAASVLLSTFILPAVNASSWSITAAAVFIVSTVGYLSTPRGARQMALGVVAAVAGAMGVLSRGDSAAFMAFASAIAVVLAIPEGS